MAQSSQWAFSPNLSVSATREIVGYTPDGWPEPDPNWRFVDALGHGHFYRDGYPTLKIVEDVPAGTDADGEEWPAETHWECATCGEHIAPGTRLSVPKPIFGVTRYEVTRTADGQSRTYSLTESGMRDLFEQIDAVTDAALAGQTPTEVTFDGSLAPS